ncbi:MAG: hypothetical protein ABIY70_18325 [Capsulimonas sp.]|uniref:hypothetical protein n=1 Tax=Capsulimonas sp. TaxID=2494211 RepID=UPI0032679340
MADDGLSKVLANLDKVIDEMHQRAEIAAGEVAAALEGWAKTEHKWGNPYSKGYVPTGATDNTTIATVTEASKEIIRITLSAGMEYDVFLELARNGKWAWLWPVIERHKGDILAMIARRMQLGASIAISKSVPTSGKQDGKL